MLPLDYEAPNFKLPPLVVESPNLPGEGLLNSYYVFFFVIVYDNLSLSLSDYEAKEAPSGIELRFSGEIIGVAIEFLLFTLLPLPLLPPLMNMG